MNLALYRKYRPQSFSEIIGQEHVVKTLTNAILAGQISHAYLFCGPRGSGKTTLARILAKAVNCENIQGSEPCQKCSNCLEITEGKSMDLIEIDAASHRGIDEIRELRDGIRFAPAKSKYKVFIIDESHQLTKEAANALLKTLEEPPSHAIFVLATTEAHKMITTIVSRCQRFDFRKLSLDEIVKRLEYVSRKEKAKLEKSAIELIAANSGGSVRDAEGILDQVITFSGYKEDSGLINAKDVRDMLGIADVKIIFNFINFLSEKKQKEAMVLLGETFDKGYDPQEFVKAVISYLRQVLILKIDSSFKDLSSGGLTPEEQKDIGNILTKFSLEEISRLLNIFIAAENKMKYSSIPQLSLELAVVEFIGDLK